MRFRYLRDPLFLAAVVLYLANRCWWKPHFGGVFLTGYFNDLLLIPAALPPILWLHHKVGWRGHFLPPSFGEIALHLVMWSFIAEGLGPKLFRHSTGDWMDVVVYTVGAALAFIWWHSVARAKSAEAV